MIERISLNHHLATVSNSPERLRYLILDLARAAKYVQHAIRSTETTLAGSVNQYGEQQVTLDLVSDDIIHHALIESGLVATFVSEEQENIVELNPKAPYSVVYDPLDGSSLVDTNFAIGSIFGIYEGASIIGRRPREMVAALSVLYGPRTILTVSTGKGVHTFLLNDVGEFVLLREHLTIAADAKNYSIGNLGAVKEDPTFAALVQRWMTSGKVLRYSGCMVADLSHILAKGQGIFTYLASKKNPTGKLRLVFECGPFAYLMDQAGGSASDGNGPILDRVIKTIDQRVPIIIGSRNEVQEVEEFLRNKR